VANNRGGLVASTDRTFTTPEEPAAGGPAGGPGGGPGAGAPAGGGGGPAPDTRAPRFSASGLKGVKLGTKGTISFFVKSDEDATGTFNGSIKLPNKLARTVRFAKKTLKLRAGARAKVTLKLSKKDAARVRKVLRRKKKLTASVAAGLRDAAGNRSAKKLSVKLKR
jgi:hypothetical protein